MNELERQAKMMSNAREVLSELLERPEAVTLAQMLPEGHSRAEYCVYQRLFKKLIAAGLVEEDRSGTSRAFLYRVADRKRIEEVLEDDTELSGVLWPAPVLPSGVPDEGFEVPRSEVADNESREMLLALLRLVPKMVDGIDGLTRRFVLMEARMGNFEARQANIEALLVRTIEVLTGETVGAPPAATTPVTVPAAPTNGALAAIAQTDFGFKAKETEDVPY